MIRIQSVHIMSMSTEAAAAVSIPMSAAITAEINFILKVRKKASAGEGSSVDAYFHGMKCGALIFQIAFYFPARYFAAGIP